MECPPFALLHLIAFISCDRTLNGFICFIGGQHDETQTKHFIIKFIKVFKFISKNNKLSTLFLKVFERSLFLAIIWLLYK